MREKDKKYNVIKAMVLALATSKQQMQQLLQYNQSLVVLEDS